MCDWEATDGCIYLVKEVIAVSPQQSEELVRHLIELSDLSDFKEYQRLRTT